MSAKLANELYYIQRLQALNCIITNTIPNFFRQCILPSEANKQLDHKSEGTTTFNVNFLFFIPNFMSIYQSTNTEIEMGTKCEGQLWYHIYMGGKTRWVV